MTTSIAADLLEEYRRAEYLLPELGLVLRVGERCAELRGPFCFVTAFNPRSESRSEAENLEAHARLRSALRGYTISRAVGTDPLGRSHDEEGFVVNGIDLDRAMHLGQEFEQNAILWAGDDTLVHLVLLR